MDHVETQMLGAGKDRLLPRMQMQFAPLRMVGRPVKAFQVARHRADGQIDTTQLKGQVVLIDFWATWCRPCVAELPHLKAAHRKFAKQGFQIVSISLDDKQQPVDDFIKQHDMNWLHHYDGGKWKNEVAVLFDVHSIPMNLLVDRQGIVRAANLRGPAVARSVEELLKMPATAPKK
jgi:peroxiredoxin